MSKKKKTWSSPECRKDVEGIDEENAVHLVDQIQSGIWGENNIGERGVKLEMNLNDLPKPRGHRSKRVDACRYNEHEEKIQSEMYDQWRLPKDQRIHINTVEHLDQVMAEIDSAIKEYKAKLGDPLRTLGAGLDTEKDGPTVQISVRLLDLSFATTNLAVTVWNFLNTPMVKAASLM